MAAASFVKYLYLAHFSTPRAERLLYRTIRRRKVASIVEIGLHDGRRAHRMLQCAARYSRLGSVSYAGIDMFEARQTEPGLTLKSAHKLLHSSATRVKLLPGDPFSALARSANSLGGTDLLVIGAGHDAASLARSWFYVPRLLHPQSVVLLEIPAAEKDQEATYRQVSLDELKQLARQYSPRRAA